MCTVSRSRGGCICVRVCAKQEEQSWWWVFFWVAVSKEWVYVCVHAFVSEYFWAFARRARSAYTQKNPWKFIRARRLLSNTKNTEEDSLRQEREGGREIERRRKRMTFGEQGSVAHVAHHARVSLFKFHSQSRNLLWLCVCVCVFQIDVWDFPSRPPYVVWPKFHMSHYVANQSTGNWSQWKFEVIRKSKWTLFKFWVLLWTVCRCMFLQMVILPFVIWNQIPSEFL